MLPNPSHCGPHDEVASNGPNACPPIRLKNHHGRMDEGAEMDDGRLARVDI